MKSHILTDDSKALIQLLNENEEWLMKRILYYADEFDYTKYTSTLEEAWRASIVGLSGSLVELLDTQKIVPELGPDEDVQDARHEETEEEIRRHLPGRLPCLCRYIQYEFHDRSFISRRRQLRASPEALRGRRRALFRALSGRNRI